MTTLVLGLVLFLGIHSISIFAHGARNAAAAKLGVWGWKAVYGVIALVGFWLMIRGYAQARLEPVVLYVPPTWLRHVAFLLMLPVFVLLLATYLPGRIKTATKHPMLAATKAWALAHLLANGMLHDVLLFGGFLAWAVADRISLKRRAEVRVITVAPASKLNDVIAVVGGVVLYWLFAFHLHTVLFGVSPMGGVGGG
ncbi:MAG: NnrU family protein [Steroidobacteraceae bacterium]|jgi:uncharacterized membrane protein|nr:NnrU family protein [Steroidobacteraceae bacterium]